VIATSGTLGFTKLLGVDCCIHDGWMYLSANAYVSNEYLYYVINQHKEYFDSVSYGAAIKNINTEILRNISVVIPSSYLLDSFQNYIQSLTAEILQIESLNITLNKMRDLLIPELITGKREIQLHE